MADVKHGNLIGVRKRLHVGPGTQDPSAVLSAASTDGGLLPPSMTTAQREAIASPAEGLVVFDTDVPALFVYQDGAWRQLFVDAITEPLTMYVDGAAGDDGNDGLSWGTAKQTFGFLLADEPDSIPHNVYAPVTVYFRNDIRARNAKGVLNIADFKFAGTGSLTIEGVLTAVETFTASGYENDSTVRGSRFWVSDATKAWTPDQWRRCFVDLGHASKYPIYANDATTLYIGSGDSQAGAYAATIYSAPELLRELASNPGVKYDFPFGEHWPSEFIVRFCDRGVTLKNAWIDEDCPYGFYLYFNTGECSLLNVALPSVVNNHSQAEYDGCSINTSGFGGVYLYDAESVVYTGNLAIYGDGSGYGITVGVGAIISFLESIIVGQYAAFTAWLGGTLSIARDVYVKDCQDGFVLTDGAVDISGYTYSAINLRFDNVDRAFVGFGRLNYLQDYGIYGWDVITEVEFAPGDEGTLAELEALTLKGRAALTIGYYDTAYLPVVPNEFDNAASGLAALNYQEAIDELATRSIDAALTMYVDGDLGDDADDGLSWGTAKKTLSFLYSGDASPLARVLNASVLVRCRGTILSADDQRHTVIDNVDGSGSLTIEGEMTDVATGFTPTAWDNTFTSVDYHAFVTVSGASWTPRAHAGSFLQFTTPASDVLYPIADNTADTLLTVGLPDLAGTEVFKIVTHAAIFKGAQVSDPSTLLVYPDYDVFHTENCEVDLTLRRINIAKNGYIHSLTSAVRWGQASNRRFAGESFSAYSGLIEECAIRSLFLWGSDPLVRKSYIGAVTARDDAVVYTYPGIKTLTVVDTCLVGNGDPYAYGIDLRNAQATLVLNNVRVTGYDGGVYVASGLVLNPFGTLIEDCVKGLVLAAGILDFYVGDIRFRDNTVAIYAVGGSTLKHCPEVMSVFDSGNTDDIVLWTSPANGGLTFAEFAARTQVANALSGSRVVYYDTLYGEYVESRTEYDGASSGLAAESYQDAIDELAARSIDADLTLYVDGNLGDDANDGLSWGTAKQTLGFLVEGESDALPRVINAAVLINVRGPIRARSATVPPFVTRGFSGSGYVKIVGELTAEETFTASSYDNAIGNQGSLQWMADGTKAWTPGQWRRHFVDIGAADMYPVRNNDGTTLYCSSLRALAGTPAGTIYSAPEVLSELVTNPGVKYDFDPAVMGPAQVQLCSCGVWVEGLWFDEYFDGAYGVWVGENTSAVTINRVAAGMFTVNGSPRFTMQVFYLNLTNYGYSLFYNTCYIGYGVVDSTDATGYGIYTFEPGELTIYRTWIGNQLTALWVAPAAYAYIQDNLYIQDCADGIIIVDGTVYGETVLSGTIARFDGVTRGIVGKGAICKLDSLAVRGWDVDHEVVFSDTDDGTFADLTANTLRGRNFLSLQTFDADYRPVLLDEYDNTGSGLAATTYQGALDELAADLADGTNYAQEVTVAKSGGQFDVIQGALDSIVDAAADKKYVVRVHPGVYTEQLTLKDYVDVVGIGPPRAVVVTSAAGTVITATTAGRSDLRNLTVTRTSTTNGDKAVEISGGTHLFYDCIIEQTSTNAYGILIDVSGTTVLQINTGQLTLTQMGASTGLGNKNVVVETAGTTRLYLRGINVNVTITDPDDNVSALNVGSSAVDSIIWQDCLVEIDVTAAPYAGTAVAFELESATVDRTITACAVCVCNTGGVSGTGMAFAVAAAGGGQLTATGNVIEVTGFALNYLASVASGDALISEFNTIDAVNGATGAGDVRNDDGVLLYHGVYARSTAVGMNCLPTHITTTTFTLGATANPITYFYRGIKCRVAADKTATLDDGAGGTTAGLYYVYFSRATGTILATKTFPGISETSDPIIAVVVWNGSDYGLVYDERHAFDRNHKWHQWAHYTVGARYYSGFDFAPTGTGAGATFTMSGGELYDEDIEFSAPSSASYPTPHTIRTFYQTGASSYAFDKVCGTTPFRVGGSGYPTYVNLTGYALTEATSAPNRYFNFFIYGVADMHTPLYCFVETVPAAVAATNGYTSLAAARAAGFPNLSGFSLSPELRPLYRLIVRADGVVQALTAEDDYRRVTSLPSSAGTTSTTASAVSFVPTGGIASGNVQLALEELDTEKAPVASPTFTGTVSTPAAQITGNGSGSTHQVVNVLYGTDAPPSTSGIPYGTIYIQHEA